MPPIFDKPTTDKYDYVVIGGGSGGSATAVSVFRIGYYGFSQFLLSVYRYCHCPGTDPKTPFV